MIGHYLKSALARLAGAPVTTLANILTLALGLLALITAWGIVSYWRSSDRDIAPPGHVVTFATDFVSTGEGLAPASLAIGMPVTTDVLAKYLREDVPQLQEVARFRTLGDVAVDAGDRTVILQGANADPEFLDIFKLIFVAGESKTALERGDGIVLTQEAAQKLFGDEPALGRRLVLSRQRNAIVTGVVAPPPQPSHLGFDGETFDYLTSFIPDPPGVSENWFGVSVTTYGLLPADGSLTSAALDRALARMVERRVPKGDRTTFGVETSIRTIGVQEIVERRLNGALFDDNGLSVVTVLFGLGGLVLGIACLNYANLATAQAVGRTKETGMRRTLGAGLGGVLLQSWIEAGASVAIALVLTGAFLWLTAPIMLAQMDIDVVGALIRDPVALISIAATAAGVTLVAGSYPAVAVSRVRPAEALRSGRASVSPQGMAQVLVGIQFAAASALLIAVFIIGQQNAHVRGLVLQRSSDPVIVLAPNQMTGVPVEVLRQQLAGYPQIKSISESDRLPWGPGPNLNPLKLSPDAEDMGQWAAVIGVGYDYFDVFDQKLLAGRKYDRGRDFVSPPSATSTPRPLVIDRALSASLGFASPKDAVGKIVYTGGTRPSPIEIIGVVEVKPHQLQGRLGGGTMYRLRANNENDRPIVRLAANDIDGGLAAIRRVWRQLAPAMPLEYQFEDQIFERNFRAFERVDRMFRTLSLLAFLISAIGLFGMAMHVIQRRMHEIGVRKTLGSSASRVVGLLLSDFSKPVIVANLLAWPIAWFAAEAYLARFTDRIDVGPWPFVASFCVTLLIAWLVVGGQTIRAATTQPAQVLRHA